MPGAFRPQGGSQDDAERPSAPPLTEVVIMDQPQASTSSAGSQGVLLPAQPIASDQDLYDDLLRRAGGDRSRAERWLSEMGYRPEDFASIPAVSAARSPYSSANPGWATASTADSKAAIKAVARGQEAMCPPLELKEKEKDPDARAAEAGAPRHFFCPISTLVMRDPVLLPTGQTYDRPCIERWLQHGNSSCPMTGQALTPPVTLTPNVALRSAIEEWCAKYAPYMLDASGHLRPVPADAQLGMKTPAVQLRSAGAVPDPNLALAIRLQQQELEQLAEQRALASVGSQSRRRSALGSRPGHSPTRSSSSSSLRRRRRSRRGCRTLTTAQIVLLSAAYIVLFVLAMWQGGWTFESMSLNPFFGPSQSALMSMGALSAAALTDQEQWWRLISSPFINAGIIQLFGSLGTLWAFGRYMDGVLPVPDLSVAFVYLASAIIGALTSGNLNTAYVACGGSAGICALLGGVWADQAINFRRYKNRLVTLLALTLVTAVLLAISLLPMLNVWYNAGAFLAGLLISGLLLSLRHTVGPRRSSRAAWWLVVQSIAALLLVAWVTLAVVGLVREVKIGGSVKFFQQSSCLDLPWWQCVEADMTPNGCRFSQDRSNGTTTMQCPSGEVVVLPSSGAASSSSDTAALSDLCTLYCPSTSTGSSGSGNTPGSNSTAIAPSSDDWGPFSSGRMSPSAPPPKLQGPLNSTIPGQQLYSVDVETP